MAKFSPKQIEDFKEAFEMIDMDKDGFIGVDDVIGTYAQLGRAVDAKEANEYIKEAPGGKMNFPAMLGLFQEKMSGTDDEKTLLESFKALDEKSEGVVDEKRLRNLMTTVGQPFTDQECSTIFKEAPTDGGKILYEKFVIKIKRGDDAEGAQ